MKKLLKCLTCFVCAMVCMFSFSACGKDEEEVYSNMTKSGFNNYLTNENTTTKFGNYELNVTEKLNDQQTFSLNLKTRTLSGKSISYVVYTNAEICADVFIAQDKVYFRFKESGTVTKTHALQFSFYDQTDFNFVSDLYERQIIKDVYRYLTFIDAQEIYSVIKDDTTRLDVSYSIKMAIKDQFDKYKINYSAEDETVSFAEEFSVNTYLEFYDDEINKIEYVKSGRRINNISFSNYELKMTTVGYNETINFPSDINEYPL